MRRFSTKLLTLISILYWSSYSITCYADKDQKSPNIWTYLYTTQLQQEFAEQIQNRTSKVTINGKCIIVIQKKFSVKGYSSIKMKNCSFAKTTYGFEEVAVQELLDLLSKQLEKRKMYVDREINVKNNKNSFEDGSILNFKRGIISVFSISSLKSIAKLSTADRRMTDVRGSCVTRFSSDRISNPNSSIESVNMTKYLKTCEKITKFYPYGLSLKLPRYLNAEMMKNEFVDQRMKCQYKFVKATDLLTNITCDERYTSDFTKSTLSVTTKFDLIKSKYIRNKKVKDFIFTLNPDHYNLYKPDKQFQRSLSADDLIKKLIISIKSGFKLDDDGTFINTLIDDLGLQIHNINSTQKFEELRPLFFETSELLSLYIDALSDCVKPICLKELIALSGNQTLGDSVLQMIRSAIRKFGLIQQPDAQIIDIILAYCQSNILEDPNCLLTLGSLVEYTFVTHISNNPEFLTNKLSSVFDYLGEYIKDNCTKLQGTIYSHLNSTNERVLLQALALRTLFNARDIVHIASKTVIDNIIGCALLHQNPYIVKLAATEIGQPFEARLLGKTHSHKSTLFAILRDSKASIAQRWIAFISLIHYDSTRRDALSVWSTEVPGSQLKTLISSYIRFINRLGPSDRELALWIQEEVSKLESMPDISPKNPFFHSQIYRKSFPLPTLNIVLDVVSDVIFEESSYMPNYISNSFTIQRANKYFTIFEIKWAGIGPVLENIVKFLLRGSLIPNLREIDPEKLENNADQGFRIFNLVLQATFRWLKEKLSTMVLDADLDFSKLGSIFKSLVNDPEVIKKIKKIHLLVEEEHAIGRRTYNKNEPSVVYFTILGKEYYSIPLNELLNKVIETLKPKGYRNLIETLNINYLRILKFVLHSEFPTYSGFVYHLSINAMLSSYAKLILEKIEIGQYVAPIKLMSSLSLTAQSTVLGPNITSGLARKLEFGARAEPNFNLTFRSESFTISTNTPMIPRTTYRYKKSLEVIDQSRRIELYNKSPDSVYGNMTLVDGNGSIYEEDCWPVTLRKITGLKMCRIITRIYKVRTIIPTNYGTLDNTARSEFESEMRVSSAEDGPHQIKLEMSSSAGILDQEEPISKLSATYIMDRTPLLTFLSLENRREKQKNLVLNVAIDTTVWSTTCDITENQKIQFKSEFYYQASKEFELSYEAQKNNSLYSKLTDHSLKLTLKKFWISLILNDILTTNTRNTNLTILMRCDYWLCQSIHYLTPDPTSPLKTVVAYKVDISRDDRTITVLRVLEAKNDLGCSAHVESKDLSSKTLHDFSIDGKLTYQSIEIPVAFKFVKSQYAKLRSMGQGWVNGQNIKASCQLYNDYKGEYVGDWISTGTSLRADHEWKIDCPLLKGPAKYALNYTYKNDEGIDIFGQDDITNLTGSIRLLASPPYLDLNATINVKSSADGPYGKGDKEIYVGYEWKPLPQSYGEEGGENVERGLVGESAGYFRIASPITSYKFSHASNLAILNGSGSYDYRTKALSFKQSAWIRDASGSEKEDETLKERTWLQSNASFDIKSLNTGRDYKFELGHDGPCLELNQKINAFCPADKSRSTFSYVDFAEITIKKPIYEKASVITHFRNRSGKRIETIDSLGTFDIEGRFFDDDTTLIFDLIFSPKGSDIKLNSTQLKINLFAPGGIKLDYVINRELNDILCAYNRRFYQKVISVPDSYLPNYFRSLGISDKIQKYYNQPEPEEMFEVNSTTVIDYLPTSVDDQFIITHPFKWTKFTQKPEITVDRIQQFLTYYYDMHDQLPQTFLNPDPTKIINYSPRYSYLTALLYGNAYYVTFDGLSAKLPPQALNNEYLLASDISGNFALLGSIHKLTLLTETENFTVTKLHGDYEGELRYDMHLNGKLIENLPLGNEDITVFAPLKYFIKIRISGLRIGCNYRKLVCYIKVSQAYHGMIVGLLGNRNMNPGDDADCRSLNFANAIYCQPNWHRFVVKYRKSTNSFASAYKSATKAGGNGSSNEKRICIAYKKHLAENSTPSRHLSQKTEFGYSSNSEIARKSNLKVGDLERIRSMGQDGDCAVLYPYNLFSTFVDCFSTIDSTPFYASCLESFLKSQCNGINRHCESILAYQTMCRSYNIELDSFKNCAPDTLLGYAETGKTRVNLIFLILPGAYRKDSVENLRNQLIAAFQKEDIELQIGLIVVKYDGSNNPNLELSTFNLDTNIINGSLPASIDDPTTHSKKSDKDDEILQETYRIALADMIESKKSTITILLTLAIKDMFLTKSFFDLDILEDLWKRGIINNVILESHNNPQDLGFLTGLATATNGSIFNFSVLIGGAGSEDLVPTIIKQVKSRNLQCYQCIKDVHRWGHSLYKCPYQANCDNH